MRDARGRALLQNLHVSDCKIADGGVEALAPLSRLEKLSLFGTRVTDDVVPSVARLPRLMVLDLRAVTLAAARPDVTVLQRLPLG